MKNYVRLGSFASTKRKTTDVCRRNRPRWSQGMDGRAKLLTLWLPADEWSSFEPASCYYA